MTPIRVRSDGPPPYEQIVAGAIAAIAGGRWLPGDRVPTVRGLAEEIGVAPNTVARAYRRLEIDGWLEGRGRAGTFVTARLPSVPSDAERELRRAAEAYRRRANQLGFDGDAARAMLDRVGGEA